MGAAHTPAPWEACAHPEGRAGVRSLGGPMVARCESMFGRRHVSGEEWEANARLIAAAPELLVALQILFKSYKELADSGDAGFWSLEDMDEGKQALAAIAKATGQ